MKYKVELCIIHPETCKAVEQIAIVSVDKPDPDYEDIVTAFYKSWDKPDKHNLCYGIGVLKMELYDNKE